jgi:hypothetical protein
MKQGRSSPLSHSVVSRGVRELRAIRRLLNLGVARSGMGADLALNALNLLLCCAHRSVLPHGLSDNGLLLVGRVSYIHTASRRWQSWAGEVSSL